jgi:hypothetical protein
MQALYHSSLATSPFYLISIAHLVPSSPHRTGLTATVPDIKEVKYESFKHDE